MLYEVITDHGSCFEIHRNAAVMIPERIREDARSNYGNNAEPVGYRNAQTDQREHVGVPAPERGNSAIEKWKCASYNFV